MTSARLTAAKVLGVAGVVAYNWWVVVPFVPGLMPSVNGFFSDLEATGRPHADLMSDADFAAGVLMVAALCCGAHWPGTGPARSGSGWWRSPSPGPSGGAIPYACSEGLSAACRSMEWHLQLPVHHYVHVVSGIAEFATLTAAASLPCAGPRTGTARSRRSMRRLLEVPAVGYPLLGLVYLTDRLGTLVEPIFFVAFSVMVLAEVFEPTGHGTGPDLGMAPPWPAVTEPWPASPWPDGVGGRRRSPGSRRHARRWPRYSGRLRELSFQHQTRSRLG